MSRGGYGGQSTDAAVSKAVLEVDGLVKRYGARTVLKGVSFAVEAGEVFALLGTNGAGKTTVLECVEGLRRPDAGSVRVRGRLGAQLQSGTLPEHIRPLEALRFFAAWRGAGTNAGVLERLDITGLGKRAYAQLSTGQKRRLHLALALTGDPDVVLLDEPTAGLDVESRARLHELVGDLARAGKAVVLSSHDMAEVEKLCDRAAILRDGAVVFEGTVGELTARAGARRIVRVLTDGGELAAEARDVGKATRGLLDEATEQGLRVLDIRVDRKTLEECFLEIAKGA